MKYSEARASGKLKMLLVKIYNTLILVDECFPSFIKKTNQTCRLVWESNQISCYDFSHWQDCFSNNNDVPSRFQTRSLGKCHQNIWWIEHWLWTTKVRLLYFQFKFQWSCFIPCLFKCLKEKKRIFVVNNSFQLRAIVEKYYFVVIIL